MSKKKSLLLFEDFFAITENLPIHCLGELWKALHCYIKGEEYNFVDAETKGCWNYIKIKLNENTEKWNETCKKRSEAGKRSMQKRYQTITNDNKTNKSYQMLTNANKCQQMLTDYDNENENENNNIKEKNILKKEKDENPPPPPPTLDNVLRIAKFPDVALSQEEARKFYDHYAGNSWERNNGCKITNETPVLVGLLRTWKRNQGKFDVPIKQKQTEINYDNGFFNVERYCNG